MNNMLKKRSPEHKADCQLTLAVFVMFHTNVQQWHDEKMDDYKPNSTSLGAWLKCMKVINEKSQFPSEQRQKLTETPFHSNVKVMQATTEYFNYSYGSQVNVWGNCWVLRGTSNNQGCFLPYNLAPLSLFQDKTGKMSKPDSS